MVAYRYTVRYLPAGMREHWYSELSWESSERIESAKDMLSEASDRIDRENNYPTYGWKIVRVDEYAITPTRTVTP